MKNKNKFKKLTLLTATGIFALSTPYLVNNITSSVNAVVTQVSSPLNADEVSVQEILNKIEVMKNANNKDASDQANLMKWILEHRLGIKFMDSTQIPHDVASYLKSVTYHQATGTFGVEDLNMEATFALQGVGIGLKVPQKVSAPSVQTGSYEEKLREQIKTRLQLLVDKKTTESLNQANAIQWMIDHRFTFSADIAEAPQLTKDWKAPVQADGKLSLSSIKNILNDCLTKLNIALPNDAVVQKQELPNEFKLRIQEWIKQFEKPNLIKNELDKELSPQIVDKFTHVKNKRDLINVIIEILESNPSTKMWADQFKAAGNSEPEIARAFGAASTDLMAKYSKTSVFIVNTLIGEKNLGWDTIRDDALTSQSHFKLPMDYLLAPAPNALNTQTPQTQTQSTTHSTSTTKQHLPTQTTNKNVKSQNTLSNLNNGHVTNQPTHFNTNSVDSNKIPTTSVNSSKANESVRAVSKNTSIFTATYYIILVLISAITLGLKFKKTKFK